MAIAIPLISLASGVTAAAGAIAAGTAIGLGTFLTIAGGIMSTIGMLEKDKDLTKLGGILSLGGAAANWMNSTSAANSAGTATATGDAMDTAAGLTGQLPQGSETLLTAPGASSTAAIPTMGTLAQGAADTAGTGMLAGIDSAGNVLSPMGGGLGNPGPSVADSLMGRAQGNLLTGGAAPATAGSPQMADFLAQQASTMTGGEVAGAAKNVQAQAGNSLFNRAGDFVKGIGDWTQKNPMAASFAMQGLSGTMAARQQQEALDFQRSLIERARQNMNSPVRLSFTPGG